jgi:hypothetical protein
MIKVFIYWDKGLEGMPPMIRHIYQHNLTMGRRFGFQVVLLSDRNVGQYIKLHPRFQHLRPNFKSDFIRYEVLHRYGGIYFDTDTIIIKNLNRLFKEFRAQKGKDAILDIEFGQKIGCCGLVMKSKTVCSEFCRRFVHNRLDRPEKLQWTAIGPDTVTALYKKHPGKVVLNPSGKTRKGCNWITWRENPGHNKKNWLYPKGEQALQVAKNLMSNPNCYYVNTWTIYRKHDIPEKDLIETIFHSKRSIFHYLTTLSVGAKVSKRMTSSGPAVAQSGPDLPLDPGPILESLSKQAPVPEQGAAPDQGPELASPETIPKQPVPSEQSTPEVTPSTEQVALPERMPDNNTEPLPEQPAPSERSVPEVTSLPEQGVLLERSRTMPENEQLTGDPEAETL